VVYLVGGRYSPGDSGGRNTGATDMAVAASEKDDTACRLDAVPPEVARSTKRATVRACREREREARERGERERDERVWEATERATGACLQQLRARERGEREKEARER